MIKQQCVVIFYDSDGMQQQHVLYVRDPGTLEGATIHAFESQSFGPHPEKVGPLVVLSAYFH